MLIGFQTRQLKNFADPISLEVIDFCKKIGCNAIELGCGDLKFLDSLDKIKPEHLSDFSYVSLHAPKFAYSRDDESKRILDKIQEKSKEDLNDRLK